MTCCCIPAQRAVALSLGDCGPVMSYQANDILVDSGVNLKTEQKYLSLPIGKFVVFLIKMEDEICGRLNSYNCCYSVDFVLPASFYVVNSGERTENKSVYYPIRFLLKFYEETLAVPSRATLTLGPHLTQELDALQ